MNHYFQLSVTRRLFSRDGFCESSISKHQANNWWSLQKYYLCFYFWFTITSAQSLSLPLDSVLQPNFFIQHSPTLVPNCSSGSGINFGNYVNCQLCQLFEELNSHWEIFYRVTASQSFYNFSSQWSWAGWALLHWQNIWNDAAWRWVNNIFGHLIIFFPHPGYGLTSEYCVDLVQDRAVNRPSRSLDIA